MKLPAIVLAAGLSTRMGVFKPLMLLAGKPLLFWVVEGLIESGAIGEIVIVAGHRADEIETAIDQWRKTNRWAEAAGAVRAVRNPDFAVGEMLSSVRAGIAALQSAAGSPEMPGFVLAFADQPAVKPETVQEITSEFVKRKPPLVIPTFLGKRGHPVVFSGELLPAIAALSPADTLRTVVHQHLPRAHLIAVEDWSILDDLDTPEDFARIEARLKNQSHGEA